MDMTVLQSEGSGLSSCLISCFWRLASASSPRLASICSPATACEVAMSFELILGGLISIGMLVYLIFALLRPEKF
jgi:K+-transporting ATPase KdpF subunit